MFLRVSLFQAPSSTLLEPEDVGRLVWVHALASLQQPCSDGACPFFFSPPFPTHKCRTPPTSCQFPPSQVSLKEENSMLLLPVYGI